ncbi:ABC transporter ATP-binding protein [Kiloniella laminariae]|uniref:ABC transporter ATP-binding protein n=1 Tax=Kiloniella laminariae TaxID=454162 RepID=A0ABT4LN38_9PROT|nr:ABC transporter ATP-binding protein [Kiloniella laminariae]MCZ4282486.1 ABC transporter ATP-binding protein [Kiloniella laminariae]
MSSGVDLEHVSIRFGNFTAVDDANLSIRKGEFFSFLGPSGCGKTTILRAISGFNEPTEGVIRINGADMRGIGPNKRPTALIFQNLALFPLMSVAENIAFGLEVEGVKYAERRRRAEELLNLIALPGQGDKMVSELSGGQKQRVAIARALAVEPQVLLLDEPLSALDLKLRQHMRSELRNIQQRVGITFIYITHDQGEALTMSDRVAVMSAGVIQQVGDGTSIYNNPQTAFVASFVGENNPFFGKVIQADNQYAQIKNKFGTLRGRNTQGLQEGDAAILFVRPESLSLVEGTNPPENSIESTVLSEEFEGHSIHIHLEGEGSKHIALSLSNDGVDTNMHVGDKVTICFDPDRAIVLPEGELADE